MLDEPEEPEPSDCCNNGCSPCVFDIYRKQLEEWKQSKQIKYSNNIRVDLLSQTRFKHFRLIKKIMLTDKFFIFRFQPLTGETDKVNCCDSTETHEETEIMHDIDGILPYNIGQHVVVRSSCCSKFVTKGTSKCNTGEITVDDKHVSTCNSNNMIMRSYTPITVASKVQNCYLDIVVKIYEHGLMSNVFKYLRLGNILDFRGPYGDYVYRENKYNSVLMVCMGTGIAPMYPIAKSIIENEVDETSVHLLYGIKNVSEILLRDELRRLTEFWNFRETICLSQEKNTVCLKFGETFVHGKIDKKIIEKAILGKNLDTMFVLICGSDMFCKNVLEFVLECSVSKTNIHIF